MPDNAGASPHKKQLSPRRALFVGRLHPVKGLDLLIDAWARVRPPDWHLDLAGPDEGGYRAVLEKQIGALGLQDSVRILGSVAGEGKTAAFGAASLFILPSYSESFGMVVAEAFSFGLPVLTTTAVPWPQIEEKACGWRAAAEIAPFVQALGRALAMPAQCLVEMGRRGHDLVEDELSWDRIAKRFVEVYSAMV